MLKKENLSKLERLSDDFKKKAYNEKVKFEKYSKEFLKNNFYFEDLEESLRMDINEVEKVYFVSGILHKTIKTKVWKKFLNEKFPKKEKVFFDDIFYIHIEKNKIKNIITRLSDSLEKTNRDWAKNKKMKDKESPNENNKILVIAHSFGGILAKTAINKLPKKFQKNIILVTLGTPHQLNYGKVDEIRKVLKTPMDLELAKIFTIGGIYDLVVPVNFSHTKKSLKRDFQSDHLMFLYSRVLIKKIFKNVFK